MTQANSNRMRLAVGAGVLAVALASATSMVQAQAGKMIAGTLTCKGKGSVGYVIGSKETLACVYVPAGKGQAQNYSGTITTVGLDIGFKGNSVIIWTVLGTGASLAPGSLAGKYSGASAEVTVAVGVGANALVGGNQSSVVLQPLSVQAQTGLNVAAGVSTLTLRR